MAMAMPERHAWTASDVWLTFLMWTVMMAAMMIPSASPYLLLFAAVNRKRRLARNPYVPTSFFLSGYLIAWTLFSIAATAAQWFFHEVGLLSPAMIFSEKWLAGVCLLLAGLYQWTPWKKACLRNCRSPLDFIMTSWREGHWGALKMGLHHGAYCLGCCWLLMILLFVTGVMNLLWVALISAFVLAEKILPGADWFPRLAGLGMILFSAMRFF